MKKTSSIPQKNHNQLLYDLEVPQVSPYGSNTKSTKGLNNNLSNINPLSVSNRKDNNMNAIEKLLSPFGNNTSGNDSYIESSIKKNSRNNSSIKKPYDPTNISMNPTNNTETHNSLNTTETKPVFDEKNQIKQNFEDFINDLGDKINRNQLSNMILSILIDEDGSEKAKRKSIKMLVKTLIRNGSLNAKIVSTSTG